MKITVDTNVLVRVATADDPIQNRIATQMLNMADKVALTLPVLCELVWVLRRGYQFDRASLADVIRDLTQIGNAEFDLDAVAAGLAMLDAGGDFADGVIAHEGRRMGAERFVSFDRRAVDLARASGFPAQAL